MIAPLVRADPRILNPDAATLLYGAAVPPAACGAGVVEPTPDKPVPLGARIECWLADRYGKDPKAAKLALALFRASGDIAGIGDNELMDGGYRGTIHLVPELPIHGYRAHLERVITATAAIDAFFTALYKDVKLTPHYRWTALAVRFVRSVGKRTPSALASHWAITYNVEGSLLGTQAGVRETLFHELFQLNDEDHGDWSATTLGKDYDAIVRRCGTERACLRPYAPNVTTVRGGTYYAFQPNNGQTVHEYAAELAVRFWDEQSAMLANGKLAAPAFKCGPPENARAWHAIVEEFFAGRDLVPAC